MWLAWSRAQQLCAAYWHPKPAEGRKPAEQVLAPFPTCPAPEIARLGRTLKQSREAFSHTSTAPIQQRRHRSVNGLIELHRRVARGFRNRANYRLRMLLIGGGLTHPNLTPPPQV